MKYASAGIALGALCLAIPAQAEPLPRPSPAAGSVIARKSGEEVRFVDISGWRYVDLKQDLLSGDVLRTNATGQLAVLFSDRTQVRLGRNTSLLVKQMGGGDTGLELQSGTIWARAERGGQGVVIDTPAAAAAIRGTDWTMTVGPDGKTSLIVLEGLVELSNAYGSVKVAQGEGAVAAIGKAPSKIVIAKPKDREQMLFNLSLRTAFQWMPATPLIVPQMRTERRRIEATAPGARSAEDWLSLSEIYLALDGKEKAKAALDEARVRGLGASQTARADLIDALIAGSENRYRDAAVLFDKARPRLDAKRGAIAAYGGYFARSLADPNHAEEPPRLANSGYGAMAKAWTAGFRQDIPAAIASIREGERNTPGDPALPAARALLGILLADEKQVVDGFERALAIDPEDPTGLEARANYKLYILNDRQGALDDLNRALKTAPGFSSIWNTIGLVHSARDANREAEAAYKKAIELDPLDPVSHANLAFLYLVEMRMTEAKREIDEALRVDPSFDIALVARGRYHLQTGEMDKAVEDLLAGSTANPGYSQGQLMLAAAHYEKGDRVPAAQALDNAERLDPTDPVIPVVRTAIAIDEYDADAAIRNAQEIMRRTRARGGDYAPLGANQQAGSTLNDAFRLQGLDAWGQYYGDVVFNPFAGSSYIDQAVRGSVDPFIGAYSYDGKILENSTNDSSYSSFIQGLLLDPHMLASRDRAANLVQRPFIEASIGGGLVSNNGDRGYTGEAELRGFGNTIFPVSVYGTLAWETTPQKRDYDIVGSHFNSETELLSGNGYLTATPSPDDRFVFYANYARNDLWLDDSILFSTLKRTRDVSAETLNLGAAWSHTIAYHNVVNAGLFYSSSQARILDNSFLFGFPFLDSTIEGEKTSLVAAVNHLYEDGNLTFRYGLEAGTLKLKSHLVYGNILPPEEFYDISSTETSPLGKAYASVLAEITPSLKAEAAVFATYLESDGDAINRLDPRLGLAWSPFEGQWLRAAYLREGAASDTPTLAPVGVLGIQSNQLDLAMDGKADTYALRWDGEWTDNLFTSVDFQHQEFDSITASLPYTINTIAIDKGRLDRASATANLLLGHGFGLSATAAINESSGHGTVVGDAFEGALPFVPDTAGRVALTWVNTNNIRATLAANYTGDRLDNAGSRLKDYWTLDANLKWESFDKRVEVNLSGFNLLDEDFYVAEAIPGWGPTFKGTVKVRF
ncbi:TonB-dependent receptor [Pararhizobium polonicum]|uniref:TonB-dependent receptor n=1 Tax=Pararhizobium polonicum TaxID=1612624 RepID=A0A1C7PBQ5_9HYPH|nr:FecR domain-containing protein [Pararhizobium polonicum]OBZ97134.1 TonB-dependent receptor [Pararhizobium polonicum]